MVEFLNASRYVEDLSLSDRIKTMLSVFPKPIPRWLLVECACSGKYENWGNEAKDSLSENGCILVGQGSRLGWSPELLLSDLGILEVKAFRGAGELELVRGYVVQQIGRKIEIADRKIEDPSFRWEHFSS